ncbi:MAG: hypothetical protein R2719_15450 [Micropruina sp.]
MADARPVEPAPRTGASGSRAWWLLLVFGAAGIIVSRLLPDGLPRSIAFQLFGLVSAVGIVVGIRMHRPARALPWYLMAAGSWSGRSPTRSARSTPTCSATNGFRHRPTWST